MEKIYLILTSIILFASGCGSSSKSQDLNNSTKPLKDKPKKPIVNNKTSSNLIINEVLAANKETILDPDLFEFSDYIELYNRSSESIDLTNYYLSDDPKDPKKWRFPSGTNIDANSYILVWADKNNTKLHTNFKLSQKKGV